MTNTRWIMGQIHYWSWWFIRLWQQLMGVDDGIHKPRHIFRPGTVMRSLGRCMDFPDGASPHPQVMVGTADLHPQCRPDSIISVKTYLFIVAKPLLPQIRTKRLPHHVMIIQFNRIIETLFVLALQPCLQEIMGEEQHFRRMDCPKSCRSALFDDVHLHGARWCGKGTRVSSWTETGNIAEGHLRYPESWLMAGWSPLDLPFPYGTLQETCDFCSSSPVVSMVSIMNISFACWLWTWTALDLVHATKEVL